MLYFYEKIDLQFEVFSPYELKTNKKILTKNIAIWVFKALEENQISKRVYSNLCQEVNSSIYKISKDMALEKIPEDHRLFIKVLSVFSYLKLNAKYLWN